MKILVVEDNAPVRETITDVLKLMGHDVLYAASAEEALERLKTLNAPIDLLISDISLPGLSGCDLYRQIKQHHPHCRGLLTSGLPSDHHDLNGTTFIQKPFTLELLMDSIEALSQQAALPPSA